MPSASPPQGSGSTFPFFRTRRGTGCPALAQASRPFGCRARYAIVMNLPAAISPATTSFAWARKSAGSGCSRASERKRSEEHTSELQSPDHLVCRLLLEKKTKIRQRLDHKVSEQRGDMDN